jgi:cytochrome o ubiquinol oxidase subunit 2
LITEAWPDIHSTRQRNRTTKMKCADWNRAFRLLPLCSTLLLGGCNWALLDPKGPIAADERSLIATAVVLMLIVVVPVLALTILFAWRYRASNTRATFMPGWAHSNRIEAAVWLVPCLIVVCLGTIAWDSSHKLDPYRQIASHVKPIRIDVVALDWKWLFIYPDLGVATVNQIAFPVNVPVNFNITSASVMNSFFIPQLGGQIYAMAGMQTKLSLMADQEGTYAGMSANYSGAGFSDMKFTALAMSRQSFNRWLAMVRGSPKTLGAQDYKLLAKASRKHPVEYFSSVDPDLFAAVLGGGDMSGPMHMLMSSARRE